MSPVEFHYAVQAMGDKRSWEIRHDFEVARYQAWQIINLTSTILKERLDHPRKLGKFPWEEEEPPQTIEEMKKAAEAMVLALGGVVVNKGPDDPPRILAKDIEQPGSVVTKNKK